MALHWKILVALALGAVVGLAVNVWWTEGVWRRLGVEDAGAYHARAARAAVLPAGVERVEDLDPENKALRGRMPHQVTAAEAERYGVEWREVNVGAGAAAWGARFAAELNDFAGKLFLQALKFIAVPIVLFSLVAGVAGLGDPGRLGRVGGKTLAVYAATTVFAAALGIGLANAVGPGRFVSGAARERLIAGGGAQVERSAEQLGKTNVWDLALNLVPANPFRALAEGNMLQVIVLAVAVGVALTLVPRERSEPLVRGAESLTGVLIVIVRGVMRVAPVPVFALVAQQVATTGLGVLQALGVYAGVVVAGLGVILLVEYPILLRLVAGVGVGRFFRAMGPAQLVALSTSSSSATLPVTMECATRGLGLPGRIVAFVCPLGATINMDGTALLQGVATVFIAQMFGHELSLGAQAAVVVLALLASVGSPGIPSGGIVMLLVMLEALGLEASGVALVLAVDRPLDMLRTAVNVSGDAMTAAIVARGEVEP